MILIFDFTIMLQKSTIYFYYFVYFRFFGHPADEAGWPEPEPGQSEYTSGRPDQSQAGSLSPIQSETTSVLMHMNNMLFSQWFNYRSNCKHFWAESQQFEPRVGLIQVFTEKEIQYDVLYASSCCVCCCKYTYKWKI